MNGTVIEFTRRNTNENTDDARDKRRGCCKNESDSGVEAERLDHCREELEIIVSLGVQWCSNGVTKPT